MGLGGGTRKLVGGDQLTTQVEAEAGRGLTVHPTVEDALEATLRLHKHGESGRLGRICEEEEEYTDLDIPYNPALPPPWLCSASMK